MYKVEYLPTPVQRHLSGLWRRRWRVVAVIWGVAILAWLAIWLIPDSYESRAHVFAEINKTVEAPGARAYYHERIDAMRFQLLTRPLLMRIASIAWSDVLLENQATRDRLVNGLTERILIESPSAMYLVISYRDRDPNTARVVVDAAIEVLMEQDLGDVSVRADTGNQELDQQIKDYEQQLVKSENAIAVHEAKQSAVLVAPQSNAARAVEQSDALGRVERELAAARAHSTDLLNQLSAAAPTEAGRELARWRIRLAELRSRHSGDHPDVLTAAARVAQLEQNNAALSADPEYGRLQMALQAALDEVEVLKVNQERLRVAPVAAPAVLPEAASAAPATQAELQKLLNEQGELKALYEALRLQRDQSSVNADPVSAVSYQVFERPEVARAPGSPPRLSLIFGGLLLAIVTGVSASAVMTAFDSSFSSAAELKKAIDLPVLGGIGTVPSAAVTAFNRRDRVRLIAALGALLMVGVGYVYLTVFQSPAAATASVAFIDGRAELSPPINGGWRL